MQWHVGHPVNPEPKAVCKISKAEFEERLMLEDFYLRMFKATIIFLMIFYVFPQG
jgi:hypothetical protein